MSEGLVNIYFKRLIVDNEPNPGKILSQFFWELFEVAPKVQDIILFNKLIKLFGREIVFEVVIDSFNINGIDTDKSLYPLFLSMAKRKYESRLAKNVHEDMSD
jgi:hypothetical protein